MTETPKPRRRGGPGGPPIYAPETAARRAEGQVSLRLAPEVAARLRELGAAHPGGVSGWVAAQAGTASPLLSPEGARSLARIARDTGLSPPEVLAALLGVEPTLWGLLLTACREAGESPPEVLAGALRGAVMALACRG